MINLYAQDNFVIRIKYNNFKEYGYIPSVILHICKVDLNNHMRSSVAVKFTKIFFSFLEYFMLVIHYCSFSLSFSINYSSIF